MLKTDVALGDMRRAETDARRVLAQQPQHPFALSMFGSIALSRGESQEAERLRTASGPNRFKARDSVGHARESVVGAKADGRSPRSFKLRDRS